MSESKQRECDGHFLTRRRRYRQLVLVTLPIFIDRRAAIPKTSAVIRGALMESAWPPEDRANSVRVVTAQEFPVFTSATKSRRAVCQTSIVAGGGRCIPSALA